MTELQLVGIAQKTIYENGAEYEGLPMYVFSEKSTRHAISRSTYREIREGRHRPVEPLGQGGRLFAQHRHAHQHGQAGRPQEEIVEFGLEAHRWTYDQLKAGVLAADVAKNYIELFKKRGYYDNYLYGPCHGTGLIEVEAPWMESISNYHLAENMTFQVDTFVSTEEFGIRWETGDRDPEGRRRAAVAADREDPRDRRLRYSNPRIDRHATRQQPRRQARQPAMTTPSTWCSGSTWRPTSAPSRRSTKA